MTRRRWFTCLIVPISIGLAACAPTPPTAIPDSLRGYYESANEYQRKILSDGVVTLGEYEGALLATKQCIEERTDGLVEVTDPFPSQDGVGLELNLILPTGETLAEEEKISDVARDAAFTCSDEYADYVEGAYLETHALSEAEIQEDLAALAGCLQDAGFEQFNQDTMRLELDRFWSNTSNEDSSAIGVCVDLHSVGYSNLPTEDD